MATLDWKGDQVLNKMRVAAAVGVDKVMSDCVRDAKRVHAYENRDGFLEASTQITKPATTNGLTVKGNWGATANYALFVEIGTSRIGSTAFQREQENGGMMWAIPDPRPAEGVSVLQSFTIYPIGDGEFRTRRTPSIGTGPLMGPRPFLRPAADANYRFLGAYIGAAYRGEKL